MEPLCEEDQCRLQVVYIGKCIATLVCPRCETEYQAIHFMGGYLSVIRRK